MAKLKVNKNGLIFVTGEIPFSQPTLKLFKSTYKFSLLSSFHK